MSAINSLFFVFCFILLFVNQGSGDFPTVKTDLGIIKGIYKKSFNGNKYAAFEGIPYAQPPVGNNRLRDPLPVNPWQGTWIANRTYKCMQLHHFHCEDNKEYSFMGEEDCLYLNVYVPQNTEIKNLDVLIFIHGGAFMFGFGHDFSPDMIVDKNLIFITFNYRLGILGFLSTEDEVIAGNFGLKDQLLALKWIKKHISAFGGNPDSITLGGMSAGGASSHIHYLSPQSKGLFNRGFSQSGVSTNPWVLMENAREKAVLVAKHLGCSSFTSQTILECLRSRNGRQIIEITRNFFHWLFNPFSPFGVVIDQWDSNPILPNHPLDIINEQKLKDIPWIFSATESEGLYPAAELLSESHFLEKVDKEWDQVIPHLLDFYNTIPDVLKHDVTQKIRNFYFQNEPITEQTFPNLIKMVGDRLFVTDIEKMAKLQAANIKSPIYFYHFMHRGKYSISEVLSGGNTDNFGASHGDDSRYLFQSRMLEKNEEEGRKIFEILGEIMRTFSQTGKPKVRDIHWIPVSKNLKDPLQFLNIESSSIVKMKEDDDLGNIHFWDSLPFEENIRKSRRNDEL